MNNFLKLSLLTIALFISGCSAPRPPKVSFSGKMNSVNFGYRNIYDSSAVIRSEQIPGFWNKQFKYSIDEQKEHEPEFLYYIAHADKITLKIKLTFIEFIFKKTKEKLRSYGATASIELLIDKKGNDEWQVILECVKYKS